MNATSYSRPDRFRWLALILGLSHFALAAAGGLRWEHVVADAVLILMPWVGPKSLAFARAAFPLWITGVLVDNQRYLPLLGPIHTGDILRLEISLFPAPGQISWPQWFELHHTAALDLICGFAYATYLLEFFVVAAYFYLKREHRIFSALAWSFFAANVIGLITYVLLPVAPPWYVIAHGVNNPDPRAIASAAGCARFDQLLGIHYFSSFYSRNPNVMGAMPSLHAAYPVLVAWYLWREGWTLRIAALIFVVWVGFAAVYLVHHYWLDVIAGVVIAIPCCWWASWVAGTHRARPTTAVLTR
jgi:membrane-associated phospholipid phosphatase